MFYKYRMNFSNHQIFSENIFVAGRGFEPLSYIAPGYEPGDLTTSPPRDMFYKYKMIFQIIQIFFVAGVGVEPTTSRLWAWRAATALPRDGVEWLLSAPETNKVISFAFCKSFSFSMKHTVAKLHGLFHRWKYSCASTFDEHNNVFVCSNHTTFSSSKKQTFTKVHSVCFLGFGQKRY